MNYWKVKNDDLLAMIDERGIIVDEDEVKGNRKFMINLLKLDDLDKGSSNKTLILNDEDEVVELDSNISQIRVAEEKKNELVPKEQVDPKDPYKGIRMMKCIFRHREDGEAGYVQLGSNGRQFYIPKDVEVVVPAYLKPVIDTSIMTRMESVTDNQGDIIQKKTNIHRIHWEFRGYVN